jgi:23S rRNA pseudouridine2605 synthase
MAHPRPSHRHVTLSRALSKLGIASRAEARVLIESGRVRLNGAVESNPDRWIRMDAVKIDVEGFEQGAPRKVYLAMNKPVGYVTTRIDELGRPTVCDLLPPGSPQAFPVGRLDLDTSGLLFFTNDTQWGESIAGADMGVAKRYRITTSRRFTEADRAALERPMQLGGSDTVRPAKVKAVAKGGLEFDITITEGKNRQVRRMCEELGIPVVALHRVAIGSVGIGTLPEGKVRPLTRDEVASFSRPPGAPRRDDKRDPRKRKSPGRTRAFRGRPNR